MLNRLFHISQHVGESMVGVGELLVGKCDVYRLSATAKPEHNLNLGAKLWILLKFHF